MSREIKFNAWNKINNTMHLFINDPDIWSFSFLNKDVFTWLEWTGLKDKNVKEIYEGDIVTIVGQLIAEIFIDLYGGVKIKYHKENVRTKMTGCMIEPIARNHQVTHEIIGNIYKNPDLLK